MTTPDDLPQPGPADPGAGYPPPPAGAPGGYGLPAPYGAPAYGQAPGGMPPLASWGARVGAALLDFLIFIIPAALLVLILPRGLGNLVGLLLQVLYGYLVGTKGYTPGKKIVGIRVLRERDGQLLGAGLGIGRQFLHILDGLPCLLGYLWPLWDAKKQTFADKIVSSVAVRV